MDVYINILAAIVVTVIVLSICAAVVTVIVAFIKLLFFSK